MLCSIIIAIIFFVRYLISSSGSIIVPLAADFTTANVQDNQMYNQMISSSLSTETCFMIGDSGYDDHKLYDLSTKRGFELVCLVQDMNVPHPY